MTHSKPLLFGLALATLGVCMAPAVEARDLSTGGSLSNSTTANSRANYNTDIDGSGTVRDSSRRTIGVTTGGTVSGNSRVSNQANDDTYNSRVSGTTRNSGGYMGRGTGNNGGYMGRGTGVGAAVDTSTGVGVGVGDTGADVRGSVGSNVGVTR